MTPAIRLAALAAALAAPAPVLAQMLDDIGLGRAQHARSAEPVDVGVPEPTPAKVFILNLRDGAEVTSPVTVEFGLVGMMVAPAGEEMEGYGHHHLLVNASAADLDLTQPLPADDNHIHFGDGARSTVLDLPAGTHTLQLVMGDHNHVPHDPPVISAPVTITVIETAPDAQSTM